MEPDWYEIPVFLLLEPGVDRRRRATTSRSPSDATELDFELEIAAVFIGRTRAISTP